MKNRDLFNIKQGLENLKIFKGAKLSFFILKNLKLIEGEISIIKESFKPTEGYLAFNEEKQALINKYSEKDENGNIKEIPNEQGQSVIDFGDNLDIVNEKVKELYIKYKSSIDENNENEKELLDADSNLVLMKIPYDYIPEDITADLLNPIFDLIEE